MRTSRLLSIGAVAVVLVLLLGLLSFSRAPEASAAPITDGSLTWGVKQSWRNYAGFPIMSAGVAQTPTGEFTFPVESGNYDPVTGSTTVQFSGSVQWQSHYLPNEPVPLPPPPGYTGPTDIFLLDVTLSDPQVVISPTESVLTVHAVSRSLTTWELVDYGRVPLVTLAVDGVMPTIANGQTSWGPLTAAFTDVAARDVFGGFYTPGLIVDPVSFSYTGDGGPPVVGESFAVPGAPALGFGGNGFVFNEVKRDFSVLWVDRDDGIVHARTTTGGPATSVHQAFDLATLQPLGQPFVITGTSAARSGPSNYSFVDPATDTVYYRSTNSGATIDATMRWDAATQQYVQASLAAPFTLSTTSTGLLWDAANQRAIGLKRVDVSANLDESQWYVATYTRQPDGSFVEGQLPLPSGPAGWNGGWYKPIGRDIDAIAADGSIILIRSSRPFDPLPDPPGGILVQRIRLDGANAVVEELPGTDIEAQTGGGLSYDQVLTNPAGHVALVKTDPLAVAQAAVAEFRLEGDALVPVASPLVMSGTTLGAFAIDPVDGTVWGQSAASRSVSAFRGGVKLSEQSFGLLHPRQTHLVVGNDHAVYALSNDGAAPNIGIQYKYGYSRLDWLGTAPVLSVQPASTTVAAGSTATFSVAGTGEPTPTIRWQVRTPGSSDFDDVEGATGSDLQVDARPEANGREYRAVLTNAAGAVASAIAALEVTSAPTIVLPPNPVTVAVGDAATFQVAASGYPEPVVTWQRDVDGVWTDVVPSASVEIGDGTLRVHDVAAGDDGARFRAQVSNVVGTVFSDPVALTVTGDGPGGSDDQTIGVTVPNLGPGEFAWSIDGDGQVALSEASNQGDHWRSTGELDPMVVSDMRAGGLAWSISGQVGDFSGGLSGRYLGWTPKVTTAGAGATPGAPVVSGFVSGNGLRDSSSLASAQSGHPIGGARVGADLDLRLPVDTPPGTYTATLTITALS